MAFSIGRTWAGLAGADPSRRTIIGFAAAVATVLFLAGYPLVRFKPQMRTLALLPTGIATSIGTQSKAYQWSEVATLENDSGFVIITFRNLNAFIVPPEAFDGVSHSQAVLAQCSEWREGARAKGFG